MKILIVGLGCSGKSTLAREIGKSTGLPIYHLDRLLWKSNWVRAERDEFLKEQTRILASSKWVYEGFNPKSLPEQISYADTIVYLDVSHLRLTNNWLKRLWKYRKFSRPDMADGNIEKFNWSYLRWLWKYDNKQMIEQIRRISGDKTVVVISNKNDRQKYLRQISTLQNKA